MLSIYIVSSLFVFASCMFYCYTQPQVTKRWENWVYTPILSFIPVVNTLMTIYLMYVLTSAIIAGFND